MAGTKSAINYSMIESARKLDYATVINKLEEGKAFYTIQPHEYNFNLLFLAQIFLAHCNEIKDSFYKRIDQLEMLNGIEKKLLQFAYKKLINEERGRI